MGFKKGENPNRPRKGSVIRVEPIRKIKDINKVKHILGNDIQQLAIFTVGINTNLRSSDLIRLQASEVINLKPMDKVVIREKKTKKAREVILNKECVSVIKELLNHRGHVTGTLFQNTKGGPITNGYICRVVKRACERAGLKGNFGGHTMRKTWGYHQHRTFEVSITDLMWCFNHSKPSQTLEYLCITAEDTAKVYANAL